MIKISNTSSKFHVFATPAGTVEVLPGETRLVDVDPESDAVKAKVAAKLILVGEPDNETEEAKPIGAPAGAGDAPEKSENRRSRRGAVAGGEGGATE